MGEIIFKTELIKGAKGDRGEAGQADSIPTDGVIAFQGETIPDGYEETDPGDVFDEVYEDINAVKDMIADEYDNTATYNAGDFCIHENGLYKCTATTTGLWDGSKWVLTSAGDEIKATTSAIEATQDMISDAYNSSRTYNVGNYCIHENAFYKCNTASTTGAWDSSKWDAVTVAGELGELTERVAIRKALIVPLIGNNQSFPERQFYITDDNTFIEFHFCIAVDQLTTTALDVDIIDIPTFAQNKTTQYSVGGESKVEAQHLIVNIATKIIWVGGFTACAGNFLCGSLRYSLI